MLAWKPFLSASACLLGFSISPEAPGIEARRDKTEGLDAIERIARQRRARLGENALARRLTASSRLRTSMRSPCAASDMSSVIPHKDHLDAHVGLVHKRLMALGGHMSSVGTTDHMS